MGRAFGQNRPGGIKQGCATIVSNRGGLPETVTDGIILKKLNEKIIQKHSIFDK